MNTTKFKIACLAVICLISLMSAAAQEYTPLVQEGRVWVYDSDGNFGGDTVCMMEFRGDTIINDTVFKKLFFYDTKKLASPQWPLAYMCEIDKKVYTVSNTNLSTKPYNPSGVIYPYKETTLLYDFNDILSTKFIGIPSLVPTLEQVEIEGKNCKKAIWENEYFSLELIEGIGPNSNGMTIINKSALIKWTSLANVKGLKYVKNSKGEIIYKGCAYKEPTGVTEVRESKSADSNVYSIDGRLIKQNATSLEGLCKGIYIFHGKKRVVM